MDNSPCLQIVKKNEGDSTTFIEVREFCTEHHLLQFFFTTRLTLGGGAEYKLCDIQGVQRGP